MCFDKVIVLPVATVQIHKLDVQFPASPIFAVSAAWSFVEIGQTMPVAKFQIVMDKHKKKLHRTRK